MRLNILGGASLIEDGRPLQRVLAQRRRLALLCMAALEWKRGISRTRAAALLWPEADDEKARHALSQLIYLLRTELRCEGLFGEVDALRLPANLLTADCIDFEAAVERGDLPAAAALYSGDLLEGVELGDSAELERWVDGHRERLKSRAADVLAALARDAAGRSAWTQAAEYWRRLSELRPDDTQIALNAMEAFANASLRETALTLGRAHEKYLREELEAAVPESLTAQLESIAKTPPANAVAIAASPSASSTGGAPQADAARGAGAVTRRRHSIPVKYASAAIGGAILVSASIAALGINARRATSVMAPADRRIAVLPFDVSGPDSLGYLRDGIVDLMASDLDVGGYSAVNAGLTISAASQYAASASGPAFGQMVATATGARYFIRGEIVSEPTMLRVTGGLFDRDAPRSPLATAVEEGNAQDLFGLVDRLSLELVAQHIGSIARRFETEAVKRGTPVAAVRSYLGGEYEMRRGNYASAMSDFREAVDADSTFALAYFRLSIAAEWQGAPYEVRQDAVTHALRYVSDLSPRERVMVRALDLQMHGEIELAHSLYRSILDRYSDDAAAWMQLAELEFHYNHMRGRSFADSKTAFENVYALTADPSALLHLARIAAWAGNSEQAESLFVQFYSARSEDRDPEAAVFRAVVTNRVQSRDSVIRSILHAGRDTILGCAWRLAQFTPDLSSADRIMAILTRPSRSIPDRRIGYQLRSYIAVIGGNWKGAAVILDSLRGLDPVRAAFIAGTLAGVPGLVVPESELRALRARVLDPSLPSEGPLSMDEVFNPGNLPLVRFRIAGLLSSKLRDTVAVRDIAQRLERSATGRSQADSVTITLATELRAMALHLSGQDGDAARLLTPLQNPGRGLQTQFEPHLRYFLGELAARTGDRAEANRWLGSFDGGFWTDLLYARPANQLKATVPGLN